MQTHVNQKQADIKNLPTQHGLVLLEFFYIV